MAPRAINDGGFWYPKGNGAYAADRGVTVRDVFAAAALAGLLSGHLARLAISRHAPSTEDTYADDAYQIADAMIRRRLADAAANEGIDLTAAAPADAGPPLPWDLSDD